MKTPQPSIGLSQEAQKTVSDALQVLLANTYVLYTKTQIFHWNVLGPRFPMLHKLFEEQYEALSEAVDEIAERIRSLGSMAPAGLAEMLGTATLKEASAGLGDDDMVKALLEDHEALCGQARQIIQTASEAGDEGTADFVTARLEDHEKTAWMLRSSL